jgi:hypothetical protein
MISASEGDDVRRTLGGSYGHVSKRPEESRVIYADLTAPPEVVFEGVRRRGGRSGDRDREISVTAPPRIALDEPPFTV